MAENGAEEPTVPIDLSRDTSALRLVPCACGGEVLADPRNPEYGVTLHNATVEHLLWRLYERPLGPVN